MAEEGSGCPQRKTPYLPVLWLAGAKGLVQVLPPERAVRAGLRPVGAPFASPAP